MTFASFKYERSLLEIRGSSSGEVSTRTLQLGGCLITAEDLKEFFGAAPVENRVMCKQCYCTFIKVGQ